MLSIFTNILEIISNIPQYILYAAETLINLIFAGVQALWEALTSLIPLPELPGPPEFIHEINWFFPLGSVIAIMTPLVIAFIAWLAVKWIYNKVGNT